MNKKALNIDKIRFNTPISIRRFGKNYWFALQFNTRDKLWVAYYRHADNGTRYESGIGETIELAVEDIKRRADITPEEMENELC